MMKVLFLIFAASMAMASADHFHYIHCCEYPELLDHSVATKCPLNTTSEEGKEQHKQRACHANCIAREVNIVVDNKFSTPKFIELVDKKLPDDMEGQAFYKKEIKSCEGLMEKMAKHHQGKHHDDPECSMAVYGMMMCLGGHVALQCPDAKKVQGPDCDKQRSFFENLQKKFEQHHGKYE